MPFRFKFSRRSPLDDITLDHVLSGDTCEPISLSDFETYLEYKEYSIENLHFVSWYQNYRRKFFALARELQALSPPPSLISQSELNAIPAPNAAKTEQRLEASYRNFESLVIASGQYPPEAGYVPHTPLPTPQSPTFSTYSSSSHNASFPLKSQPSSPLLSYASSFIRPAGTGTPDLPSQTDQPFRHECERVAQTFVKTGGSKEIMVDSQIRDMVIRDLTWTTHPDIFLPIYEQAYDTLSTVSLPHFLRLSATNVNKPKALFWLRIGTLNLTIALIVSLATILSIDDYTLRKPVTGGWDSGSESRLAKARAWRLFAVPCATLGGMQFWSAYKGFCSDVWGRGRTQLRPWELDLVHFDGSFDEDSSLPEDIELSSKNSDLEHGFPGRIRMDKIPSSSSASSSLGPNTISSVEGSTHHVHVQEARDEADKTHLAAHPAYSRKQSAKRIPQPRIDTELEVQLAQLASLETHEHNWSEHVEQTSTQEVTMPDPASLGLPSSFTSSSHSSPQTIAPFSHPSPSSSPKPQSRSDLPASPHGISSQDSPSHAGRFGEDKEIPMHGPERIILDKRIAAVHKQVLMEMLWIGFVWGTLFTTGLLAIPGRR